MKKLGLVSFKKFRFARQLNKRSCGPTAIANAAKWAGFSYSLRDNHSFLMELCECENGTEPKNFNRVLRATLAGPRLSILRRRRPSIKDVLDHIKKPNCAAVLEYYYPIKGSMAGHYALVIDATAKHVICVNDQRDKTINMIPLSTFKRRLTRTMIKVCGQGIDATPTVWFLKKR